MMWRKKQNVLLMLVTFCMTLSLFFPVGTSSADGIQKELSPFHFSIGDGEDRNVRYFPYTIVSILSVASASLAVLAVRASSQPLLQLRLGALNSFLIAFPVGLAVYFTSDLTKQYQEVGQYGLALLLPAVAMLCNVIANRFIRKDVTKSSTTQFQ